MYSFRLAISSSCTTTTCLLIRQQRQTASEAQWGEISSRSNHEEYHAETQRRQGSYSHTYEDDTSQDESMGMQLESGESLHYYITSCLYYSDLMHSSSGSPPLKREVIVFVEVPHHIQEDLTISGTNQVIVNQCSCNIDLCIFIDERSIV